MFDPRDHLIKLKSRNGPQDYLPVQFRLVWFRQDNPNGTIETDLVHLDVGNGIAVFKAVVKTESGATATGYGMENVASFGDFLEKAETKSVGRALAALGYGTQFAPELDEQERICDSPVSR